MLKIKNIQTLPTVLTAENLRETEASSGNRNISMLEYIYYNTSTFLMCLILPQKRKQPGNKKMVQHSGMAE